MKNILLIEPNNNTMAGNAISNATLDLDGTSTGLSTDANGKASIPDVPYGSHTIKVTKV